MRARWALALFVMLLSCRQPEGISLWHSYRGDSARVLEKLALEYEAQSGEHVELLSIPFDAFASKVKASAPYGHGADLFIDAHTRLGTYDAEGAVVPLGIALPNDAFDAAVLQAVTHRGVLYGAPLESKCIALYERADLPTLSSFEEFASSPRDPGAYPFAYEAESPYFHAFVLHSEGGQYLVGAERYSFVGPSAERSLERVRGWIASRVIPPDANGALVAEMFQRGETARVVSGPWFRSDVPRGVSYRVRPLPPLATGGARPRPFLTVDAVFVTPRGSENPRARAFAAWLSSDPVSARTRQDEGGQVVARLGVASSDPAVQAFQEAATNAVPMPTTVRMQAVWLPAEQALKKALRGEGSFGAVLATSEERFRDTFRRAPPASPGPLLLALGALLLALSFILLRRARDAAFRARLRASLPAYAYVTHAVLVVLLLVVLPLVAGALVSLFSGTYRNLEYVGFGNYVSILSARGGPLFAPRSFYFTLGVTVLWTLLNVTFHLALGVSLGVLLSRPRLFGRSLYRALLVLPWAVPSYVTALAWKGMFHRQYGAINALLGLFGVEPVSFFSKFGTALTANVTTNVWLGFPFMMVVTMGALSAIPKEVLEAADVDGATPLQKFFRVTLPLLRPQLLPAAVLGAIWTFNMFNVVFLVSGGEPDETTDILVSEAYRWAFSRDAQMGYAAAYAVVIFVLLFLMTRLSERMLQTSPGKGT